MHLSVEDVDVQSDQHAEHPAFFFNTGFPASRLRLAHAMTKEEGGPDCLIKVLSELGKHKGKSLFQKARALLQLS